MYVSMVLYYILHERPQKFLQKGHHIEEGKTTVFFYFSGGGGVPTLPPSPASAHDIP